MTEEQAGKRARELFLSGLNCAESVLSAGMEHLDVTGDWIPRVASGFGTGIGLTGQTCGAISGVVIASGWVLGRNGPDEKPDMLYEVGGRLMRDFTDRFGTTLCRHLISVDLSDPVERKMARERGVFADTCAPIVEWCAAWIVSNLQGTGQGA